MMTEYEQREYKKAAELKQLSKKHSMDQAPERLLAFSQEISSAIEVEAANGVHYFKYLTISEFAALRRKRGPKTEKEEEGDVSKLKNESLDVIYGKGELLEEEEMRFPLFYMKLPEQDPWSTIRGLTGYFDFDQRGSLHFYARINEETYISIPCYNYYEELTPTIIKLLCLGGYCLKLVGLHQCGLFLVQGIHVLVGDSERVSDMRVPLKLTDRFLQALIKTAAQRFAISKDFIETQINRASCSAAELYYLYNVDKASYPPELQEWIERSFNELYDKYTDRDKDTRRHIQNALIYILSIDWKPYFFDIPSVDDIKKKLDDRFYGLQKVKEQLLEVAAHIRQTYKLPKWGILIHGPAGVGKTSIANAIAEILGLPMAHLEFSIIRDSEGLTGSSRIYSNAAPGLIIKQLFQQKSANLVMVLNEIDKAAGAVNRGNPLDVLLPLLDKMGFTDTYIEATIPTDGIFFIATCNEIDCISQPILDRFYRIDVPAYSQTEKEKIFDGFIFPKVLESANVDPDEIHFTPEAKKLLLQDYALDPGVRDLERYAEKIVNHYILVTDDLSLPDAELVDYNEEEEYTHIEIDAALLKRLLGPAKAIHENIALAPGTVYSGFIKDGSVCLFALQALICPGDGSLKMINIDSLYQRGFCQMAFEYMKSRFPKLLEQRNVILAANRPLYDSPQNYIGFAAGSVILSALTQATYSDKSLFWGGCDLLGTLYCDDTNIDPLLRHVDGKYRTIYSAFGTTALIYDASTQGKTKIVEFPQIDVFLKVMEEQGKIGSIEK